MVDPKIAVGQPRGLYIVMTDIDNTQRDEFNRWYDSEHLADVASKPGVLSGMRYFAGVAGKADSRQGWPQYVAMYELLDCAVVEHPSFELLDTQPSEWSLRMSPRVIGRNVQRYLAELRVSCNDCEPGQPYPQQLVIERGDSAPSPHELDILVNKTENSFFRYYRVLEGNSDHLLIYAPKQLSQHLSPYLRNHAPGSPCVYHAGKVYTREKRDQQGVTENEL